MKDDSRHYYYCFYFIFWGKKVVTTDWSEARVDPLAALFIQRGGQTGKYQAVGLRAT